VDCSAWGKQAETIAQWCKKGKPLFVEGRLKLDTWQDKDGGNRSKLTVTVENFQFLGSRADGDGGQGGGGQQQDDPGEFDPTAATGGGYPQRQQQRPQQGQQNRQQAGRGGGRF
jgi:single-strand DNA-binding protein